MPKCVIFDLDGTLINSIEDLAVACNYALEKNNLKKYDVNEYYAFVGNGMKNLCKNALLYQDINDEKLLELVYLDFKEYYNVNYNIYSLPYEGIKCVITYLKEKGYLIGVYSNKEEKFVKNILSKHFNLDDFTFILGESINYPLKPNPLQLIDKLNSLNIDINNCYFVGDSEVDIMTAKNANIIYIGVTYGFRNSKILKKFNPKYLVSTPIELINIIK